LQDFKATVKCAAKQLISQSLLITDTLLWYSMSKRIVASSFRFNNELICLLYIFFNERIERIYNIGFAILSSGYFAFY